MVLTWMVVLIACLLAEAATTQLLCIWFAAGSLAAMIAAWAGGSLFVQLLFFAVLSALLLIFVRPMTSSLLRKDRSATNADRIIGQKATVTEEIDNQAATGQVYLMGQYWTARSQDGAVIPVGTVVEICTISGVKAIVQTCTVEV
ncbi:MAG: NfeD family protein [Butyricicoccaceae bacterium]